MNDGKQDDTEAGVLMDAEEDFLRMSAEDCEHNRHDGQTGWHSEEHRTPKCKLEPQARPIGLHRLKPEPLG